MRKERKDRKLKKPTNISKIFKDAQREEKEPIEEEVSKENVKQEHEIEMKQEC